MLNLTWKGDCPCLFGVTISSLWYFRNKFVFDNDNTPASVRLVQVRVHHSEFNKLINKLQHSQSNAPKESKLVRWFPPIEGGLKLNVDGSFVSHSNGAACGGAIRNHLGHFLKEFTCNLGSCSIMQAELWGIIHGLQVTTANNITNIIVESNSISALNFIKKGCPDSHPCAPLVADICMLACRIPNIQWSHTLREANFVADHLAKKGHELPFGVHLFDAAPPDILHLLAHDCSGISFVRGYS
ncbi:hypothetical protein AHAS_Ahas15G0130800 [Arachis hypogaea]